MNITYYIIEILNGVQKNHISEITDDKDEGY
jgi:hypothetical protein